MGAKVEVDVREAWEAVFGNDGQGFAYWCGALRDRDGEPLKLWLNTDGYVRDWVANPQDFTVYDFEEDTWYEVQVEQLVQAYVDARFKYPHLFVEPDAWTEDAIMQLAVFGELVYG